RLIMASRPYYRFCCPFCRTKIIVRHELCAGDRVRCRSCGEESQYLHSGIRPGTVFGSLVFTDDGSFRCPVCAELTPSQRDKKHKEAIVCSFCKSEFTKHVDSPEVANGRDPHGVIFVLAGPIFHHLLVMQTPPALSVQQ
ncbi:MAG: hypothetical protein PHY10_02840, partial [Patescibacteria group bacterium]|nr:hypothetical protein [Patescibacteria group bacterium]